jgi:RNA polymerase sigma factor (sigma-70 family)
MNQTVTLHMEDPIPTRYSLLSRLQSWDDQESWKEFFDTYWRLIYSVALKSGLNEAEAQDVVQETIISVAKDLEKFKRDPKLGSFKGWLRNLTRWRIADQFRKRGRHGQTLSHDDSPMDITEIADPAGQPLESKWEEEWQSNLLKAAIERAKHKVKEEHFQIFDLYVIKQWPVTQVARLLGINVGRVYLAKFRVSAAIKNEVRLLEKKWS